MPEHGYADVNGVRLHYVTEGSGSPIVFVHGFPEFWYEWRRQLAELGRDHRAIAFDMRGHNLSSKPAELEAYRVDRLVEDLRALTEHLGHRRFSLVGHDWGGAVAWAFAIAHPDRLERLVIVNAPHPAIFARLLREDPAQQKASEYMLAFRSDKAEEILSGDDFAVLKKILISDLRARGRFTADDERAYVAAWSQPGALTGGLNFYRAARVGPPARDGEPASGTLGTGDGASMVRVPTLVIWGEQDTALLPQNLDGLERYVPELTVRRIPDGTHWVIHEQPELVTRLIREFVDYKSLPE
ncbi:MAG TPA: alpha/beta hydrolase [Methylomirabilota bacterium]|jgi:pimeloyl-ACP methyl ester carboxylesterase|nr:alpha/beta hydrolase [Methylomirabilota bacterium]